MEQDNKRQEPVFSKRVRAGRRRTYFFDVRTTRSNDYYLTITESKKKRTDDGTYERHKIFLYKEDFNKFLEALQETIDKVKTDLLPEYNFDEFTHREFENDRPPVEKNNEGESTVPDDSGPEEDDEINSEPEDEPMKL